MLPSDDFHFLTTLHETKKTISPRWTEANDQFWMSDDSRVDKEGCQKERSILFSGMLFSTELLVGSSITFIFDDISLSLCFFERE